MNHLVVIYIILTLVVNIVMGMMFRKDSFLNFLTKTIFILLVLFGGYLVYTGNLLG